MELKKLSYGYDQVAFVDAKTMEIHHTKHHQTYLTNLLNALATENIQLNSFEQLVEMLKDLSKVPSSIQMAVRNNGGGHFNHDFFWQVINPINPGTISEQIKNQIETTFGNYEQFEADFTAAALQRFGSGWAWLVKDNETKQLSIISTANQDTPLELGKTPVLGLDVWEHAYYLRYQNLRVEYVKEFLKNINWEFVNSQI